MQNLVFLNKINCLRISIFIFPIIFIIITLPNSAIFESVNYSHQTFIMEDGPIENATSFIYLLSSIFSILISVFFIKTEKKLFGILYLILFVFFIVMALEEINWGERIFVIQYQDFFTSRGASQLSLHNLPGTTYPLYILWIVIGFVGTFGCALFLKRGKTKYNLFVRNFIPNWFFGIYFFQTLLYTAFELYHYYMIHTYSDFFGRANKLLNYDPEINEFLVSVGIIFFISSVYFRLKFRGLEDIESENKREKISINRKIIITYIVIILFSIIISVYLSERYSLFIILYGDDLSNLDLSNIDLSGKDLRGIILTGANLANANLAEVDLSGKDLRGTILTGANLANANLAEVDLSGKDLRGTILEDSNLKNVILTQANLTNANLINSNLSNAIILGAIMNGVNLENANLKGANLQGTLLINANLQGADLTTAKLSGAHLNNANLQNALLYDVNLVSANLSNANLFNAKLENVNLKWTILSCVNHPICH